MTAKKTQIFPSYQAFLDREDKTTNGVSEHFAKDHPDYEKDTAAMEDIERCAREESELLNAEQTES